MGACCGKDQHSTTAYESRAKADDEPAVATPNREHRKGSIAHFSPQAKDLQTKQVSSWEKLRRAPICAESFKPERQVHGRRTSVVSVPKQIDDLHFIVSCLQDHPLFQHLTKDQIGEIASVMVPVQYLAGATVYFSWERGDDLYLIRRGRVQFGQTEKDQAVPEPGQRSSAGASRKMPVTMDQAATRRTGNEGGDSNSQPFMGATDGGTDNELGDGSLFGELAGLWSSRRGFTAKTLDVCDMFTIGREALRRSITTGFSTRRRKATTLLNKAKIFQEMAAVSTLQIDMMSLADSLEQVKFESGDVLFSAGTSMEDMYIIIKGELTVVLNGMPDGQLLLSTAGDYVGEACLVRGGLLWSGTATATMELTCYKLSRSSFKSKFPLVDATTGVKDASVPPCLSATEMAEREGPLIAAANSEIPQVMHGRTYAEFQRVSRQPTIETDGLDETPDLPVDEEANATPSEFDGKVVQSTDFNWCCNLNERERIVGSAYWAGKEGWRAGVRVYLATYKPTGTPYAIRVYDKAAIWSENGVNEAREEFSIIKGINHARTLRLLCNFTDERCMYYVMDLVLGTTVHALMQQQRFKYVKEEWGQHFALQTLEALKYMHVRGFVHRNIHPEAMLLDKDGWLRLGGTMFIRSPRTNARLWTVCGVPDYLAPEVIQGLGHSRMSDFWALGVLIHEMCTGRPPFDGDDPLDSMRLVLLNESKIILQDKAGDLVAQLLQPKPTERLGFAAGKSHTAILRGIKAIQDHEWFSEIDKEQLARSEGTTPLQPPSIPIGELIGQRVPGPYSMKGNFLNSKYSMLSPEESEAFEDW